MNACEQVKVYHFSQSITQKLQDREGRSRNEMISQAEADLIRLITGSIMSDESDQSLKKKKEN